MTRAEEQAERFRNTQCPAKVSRKKLRQLMPQNRANLTSKALQEPNNPFYMPGRKRGGGHFHQHYVRPTLDRGSNFMVFLDAIKSLGGAVWDMDHEDKTTGKKVHSGGRREMRSAR
jgi:hypothetical protein